MESVKEILNKMDFKERQVKCDIDFGFKQLNELISYLPKSKIITLYGLPESGKTSLALNMLISLLGSENCSVLYLTKHETSEMIMKRLIALCLNLPLDNILKGNIYFKELLEVYEGVNYLKKTPLYIHESIGELDDGADLNKILAKFATLSSGYKYKVVFYDEYKSEKHLIEQMRKELKKYDMTLILLSVHDSLFFNRECKHLEIYNHDCYLSDISNILLSICRKAQFEPESKDNTLYISVLKNIYDKTGVIKYEMDPTTLLCLEVGITDEEPPVKIGFRRTIFNKYLGGND
jgi:hypothetical protein